MNGYFKIRLLETCSICCLLGLFPTLATNKVASVRAISFLTFLESPSKSCASIQIWVSARQASGMTIRSEDELVVDLNEPESLLLPALQRDGPVPGGGSEPGETEGDGEGLPVVPGELMVPSELDVVFY